MVVCVTPDPAVRERVARQLSGCGIVVMCTDLDELRAVFCPSAHVGWATVDNGAEDALEAVPPDGVLVLGDLVIDPGRHLVTWRGGPLRLSRLEWELLGHLATPPTTVWTYERLFGTVWGGAYLGDTSILHSAVKRLRRKLRAAGDGVSVETIRGIGYRLAVG